MVSRGQFLKAAVLISVTVAGIVTRVTFLLKNAFSPIYVTGFLPIPLGVVSSVPLPFHLLSVRPPFPPVP